MEEVDIFIRNIDALTLDSSQPERHGVDLVINRGRIMEIGKNLHFDAKEEIEGKGKVIMPGLVDAHTHAFQIFLRGALTSKERIIHPLWLKVLIPFEAELTKEEGKISSLLACLNMIRKGITAFADAGGPYPDILCEIAEKSGLRARITGSTMDRGPENYNFGNKRNADIVSKWNSGRVRGWYSIRQIMVSSDQLIDETFTRANKDSVGVHMHLNEETAEINHSLERWGRRPFEYLASKGYLSERLLAAHCAFLSDNEVKLISKNNVNVVHCPMSNLTYMTFPKVTRLLEEGANVALGSDGGSYRALDLFTEINIALASQVGYYGTPFYDYNILSGQTLLKMASSNGYKAIMEDHGGIIRKGALADMVIIDKTRPHLVPMHDITSLPLFVNGQDIVDVIVDGKIIMRESVVRTLDEREIIMKAKELEPIIFDRIRKYTSIGGQL